ncbi:MAG: ABC transporter substrate-binding protein [Armatimonadota bacterium]
MRILKSLWLGVLLILITSAMLLFSDLDSRKVDVPATSVKSLPRLAVMQWASTDLLDHTVEGIVEGLQQQGFVNGKTADIRLFNASGDNTTGYAIAQELVGGRYDMVLTASTLALQAVAKTNKDGRVVHVFGAVTDPYGAGVGITGPGLDQHPPHLVGVGTFQPVERAFRIARQMNPAVKSIGVVWNPGESNSEACVLKARGICKELGLKLIEANAGTTTEVPEAIRSVLARGSKAIWVGGDTVAMSSMGTIVSAARASMVPVFTNDPTDSTKGALFGVGASYQKVGNAVGQIGAQILKGASPKSFGVKSLVPEVLTINKQVAGEFKGWSVSASLWKQTEDSSASSGAGVPSNQPPSSQTRTRPWEIRIVRYNDAQFSEETWRGVMDGFKKQGLQEGRDFNVRCLNAQGDMVTLSSIMTAIRAEKPDIVISISTPALQATLRQLHDAPIVFGSVGDGVVAGAGKSVTDHLPNVTGITTRSPFEEMAKLIKDSVPGIRKVGTLFTPAEINSVTYRKWFSDALQKEGLQLVAVPVTSSADTSEAATALLQSGIQLIAQIADSTTRPGLPQVIKRADGAKIPFFCFESTLMDCGATLALARDYYHSGIEASEVAVRVLRGASPKDIPFANTKTETLTINKAHINRYGIRLSSDMLRKAKSSGK